MRLTRPGLSPRLSPLLLCALPFRKSPVSSLPPPPMTHLPDPPPERPRTKRLVVKPDSGGLEPEVLLNPFTDALGFATGTVHNPNDCTLAKIRLRVRTVFWERDHDIDFVVQSRRTRDILFKITDGSGPRVKLLKCTVVKWWAFDLVED